MSEVTAWAIANFPAGWGDHSTIYVVGLADSSYTYDSAHVTISDASAAGFDDAGIAASAFNPAGQNATGSLATAADITGLTYPADMSGLGLDRAGTISQLLVWKASGGHIVCHIDLTPFAVTTDKSIGLEWTDGKVFDVGTPATFAPTITAVAAPPPTVTDADYPLTFELYESDNTTLVTALATDVIGTRSFQRTLNQFGNVSVSVPVLVTDDSTVTVNTEATDLTRGSIIRAKLNGTPVNAGVVRARQQTAIDSGGNEKAQLRKVTAEGIVAEWDRAIYPQAPGAVDFKQATIRHHGWMSKEADITAMSDPSALRAVLGGNHPDPWIWPFTEFYDASTNGYFVIDRTFASDTTFSAHNCFVDNGNVWLNGVPAGSGQPPPTSNKEKNLRYAVVVPAGTHRFAYDVSGLGGPETAFAVSAGEVVDATSGKINGQTFLFHTGIIPLEEGGDGTTRYPWKCSATPQGCTYLQVILSVLAQVQDEQDLLTDWTVDDPNGDGTIDSNENEIDREVIDEPMQVGMKMGSGFLAQLCRTYCDVQADITTKTLYTYRYRELGSFHTSPGTVPIFSGEFFGAVVGGRLPNIVQLIHQEKT